MATGHGPQQDGAAKATDDDALAALRKRIDTVDSQIQSLLAERARIALEVGEVKNRTGSPVYRPEREADIFRKLRDRGADPLGGAAIEAIYREIISACREVERRMRVAYLGPQGTFSEIAVHKHFGSGVDAVACASIDEVFRAARAGTVDFGVVPIENSTEGSINRTLDLFLESSLIISGEVLVPVHHCLMGQSADIASIQKIQAHPQALAQCAHWLTENLPGIAIEPVSSNAQAASNAGSQAGIAAIAAKAAASRYGLQVIREGVQDNPGNRTRFSVIGQYECGASGADQTSLILSVPDQAGAVHRLIEPLARHGVSMKRIESRPARQAGWEYFFYIDVLGHPDDPPVKAALDELRANSTFFKLVGAYPRSTES
ncbi:MAG: prephenate dehydratase [Burkholderiaceae bacterium]